MEADLSGGQSLAAADPIFYDVKFVDAQNGWIVGEFGKILRTRDGGETWKEQTQVAARRHGVLRPARPADALRDRRAGTRSTRLRPVSRRTSPRTSDGGEKWAYDKIDGGEVKLQDPLYDVVRVRRRLRVVRRRGRPGRARPSRDPTSGRGPNIGQDVLTWLRAVSFSDPQNGWMVGGYGLIYHTEDGGKSWLPVQG